MKNIIELNAANKKAFALENLKGYSENWDRRTAELVISFNGSGNMFGGRSKFAHITLHGENSIFETETVDFNGFGEVSYNIARGANGGSGSSTTYFKCDKDGSNISIVPTYKISVEGTCADGVSIVASCVCAKRANLIKDFETFKGEGKEEIEKLTENELAVLKAFADNEYTAMDGMYDDRPIVTGKQNL